MSKLVRPGFLRITLSILAVALLIAYAAPNVLRRRLEVDEVTAPRDLCNIHRAVDAYIAEHGATPQGLSSLRGRVLPALSCDSPTCDYRRYRFRYTVSEGSGKPRYSVSAKALMERRSSFYVDDSGVLRYTRDNREATASDAPLESAARPCEPY